MRTVGGMRKPKSGDAMPQNVGRKAMLVVIAGLCISATHPPHQSVPVETGRDEEIVVTGILPALRGRRWSFRQHAHQPMRNYRGRRSLPGKSFDLCIPDGAVRQVIDIILLGQDGSDAARGCSVRTISIVGTRLSGRMKCSRGNFVTDKDFRGEIDADHIDIRTITSTPTLDFRTRLTGSRTGECTDAANLDAG